MIETRRLENVIIIFQTVLNVNNILEPRKSNLQSYS